MYAPTVMHKEPEPLQIFSRVQEGMDQVKNIMFFVDFSGYMWVHMSPFAFLFSCCDSESAQNKKIELTNRWARPRSSQKALPFSHFACTGHHPQGELLQGLGICSTFIRSMVFVNNFGCQKEHLSMPTDVFQA
jgi:hypothetical protein